MNSPSSRDRIFISYRHSDSSAATKRLAGYLSRAFGASRVFHDLGMQPGVAITSEVRGQLAQAKVVLVVIGTEWLKAANEHHQRRIDDADDWVRTEVRESLASGVPVIPVLVEGANMPSTSGLPDDLHELVDKTAAELGGFGHRSRDLAALTERLSNLTEWDITPARREPGPLIGLAAALLLVIGALLLWPEPGPDDSGSDDETTITLDDGGSGPEPTDITQPEGATGPTAPAGPVLSGDCTTPGQKLSIGAIFPQGPSLGAGVASRKEAAAQAKTAVNEAGGVFGTDIELQMSDLEEEADAAVREDLVQELADSGVDALLTVIGSADGLAILNQTEGMDLVQFSASQTAPDFKEADRFNLYFRTAPSDFLQARVLADLLDDKNELVVLYRSDPYGEGILRALRNNFEFGSKRIRSLAFSGPNDDFSGLVARILDANRGPEALVIVGYDEETAIILRTLHESTEFGALGADLWGVDGNANVLARLAPDEVEILEGFSQTVPWGNPDSLEAFHESLQPIDPEASLSFTAQTYDAVIILALAAVAAECDGRGQIAPNIISITRPDSDEAEACSTFERCRDLIVQGRDIDYRGYGGEYDFLDWGEPSVSTYRIDTYGSNGRDETKTEYVTSEYCRVCEFNDPRITFGNGSDALGSAEAAHLDEVASTIRNTPEIGPIEIQGFASPDGAPQANQALSERRAEVVRQYLVDQGVDEQRLTAKGFGARSEGRQARVVLFAPVLEN